MGQILEVFILAGYNIHKNKTATQGFPVYVLTWNGVKHWAEFYNNTVKMFSIQEGTDGETYLMDTGTLTNPSTLFIREQIDKAKELL